MASTEGCHRSRNRIPEDAHCGEVLRSNSPGSCGQVAPMLKRSVAAFAVFLLVCQAHTSTRAITAREFIDHVKHLTTKEMRGRGTGTPELDRAAAYIAREFHKAGLRPLNGAGYYQSFPVSIDGSLGPQNTLSYMVD